MSCPPPRKLMRQYGNDGVAVHQIAPKMSAATVAKSRNCVSGNMFKIAHLKIEHLIGFYCFTSAGSQIITTKTSWSVD